MNRFASSLLVSALIVGACTPTPPPAPAVASIKVVEPVIDAGAQSDAGAHEEPSKDAGVPATQSARDVLPKQFREIATFDKGSIVRVWALDHGVVVWPFRESDLESADATDVPYFFDGGAMRPAPELTSGLAVFGARDPRQPKCNPRHEGCNYFGWHELVKIVGRGPDRMWALTSSRESGFEKNWTSDIYRFSAGAWTRLQRTRLGEWFEDMWPWRDGVLAGGDSFMAFDAKTGSIPPHFSISPKAKSCPLTRKTVIAFESGEVAIAGGCYEDRGKGTIAGPHLRIDFASAGARYGQTQIFEGAGAEDLQGVVLAPNEIVLGREGIPQPDPDDTSQAALLIRLRREGTGWQIEKREVAPTWPTLADLVNAAHAGKWINSLASHGIVSHALEAAGSTFDVDDVIGTPAGVFIVGHFPRENKPKLVLVETP